MPLVLQPTWNGSTREELEGFLDGVRARRLVAAIEYANSRQLKLDQEHDLAQRKLAKAYELLGKDVARMEALDNKIQDQMIKVETLFQEVGFMEFAETIPKKETHGNKSRRR